MKAVACPHCQTPVSDGARVCSGCGAEVVRGATRRERFLVGVGFAVAAFLILTVVLRMFQIERGSLLLPSPKADGALFIFLGLIGLLVFAYIIGKRVAHFLADLKSASTVPFDINSGSQENPLHCESEEPITAAYVRHFNAN
jgi:predicted nucleic acid-binding Zn ribbon protein